MKARLKLHLDGSICPATIGQRLREERERLSLSQTDFGAAVGVTRKSQFNYESGSRSPDAKYLACIYQLGVDVLYVITGHREKKEAA